MNCEVVQGSAKSSLANGPATSRRLGCEGWYTGHLGEDVGGRASLEADFPQHAGLPRLGHNLGSSVRGGRLHALQDRRRGVSARHGFHGRLALRPVSTSRKQLGLIARQSKGNLEVLGARRFRSKSMEAEGSLVCQLVPVRGRDDEGVAVAAGPRGGPHELGGERHRNAAHPPG